MDRDDVVAILFHLHMTEADRLYGKTHYPGCWEFHVNCALGSALGIIEDLQYDLSEQSGMGQ